MKPETTSMLSIYTLILPSPLGGEDGGEGIKKISAFSVIKLRRTSRKEAK
ncbi:hypothetical protein KAU86_05185 [bacterium]|nr:hypothetical protein [bacterium]